MIVVVSWNRDGVVSKPMVEVVVVVEVVEAEESWVVEGGTTRTSNHS